MGLFRNGTLRCAVPAVSPAHTDYVPLGAPADIGVLGHGEHSNTAGIEHALSPTCYSGGPAQEPCVQSANRQRKTYLSLSRFTLRFAHS